jgi:small-conductance mechanosensitive channel
MRGGIIVKFPLEFPYDVDIEQVRKVIKKVGQAMLQDEELGGDFILPIKSQGVNEITNSVMIIRVKFTSKPGKQFTIKREAFRRITEALAAKGIHYAHRKVIVDFPDDANRKSVDEETRKKALEAGAAAIMAAEADQQKLLAAAAQEE